jgi:hypothetical protein
MIREIFNAITPENISSNPIYADIIEAFLQEIEEKSVYSININNVFKSEDPIIRLQLIKTYLNSFYKGISNLKTTNLIGSLYSDVSTDIVPRIEDILNNEYFASSKTFKEKKGTKLAIEYVYKLVERLNTAISNSNTPFKLEEVEGEKFFFNVEGNLTAEVYDSVVKPLAHPAGFAYVYTQVLSELIQDYYHMMIEYKDITLKILDKETNDEIFNFVGLGSVLITGPAVSGATLTAHVTDIDTDLLTNFNYVWSDGTNTLGTSSTLLLTDGMIGKEIFITVNYSETVGGTTYNREIYSKVKSAINNFNTVQIKDNIGRVCIVGDASFDINLPSLAQTLTAEIYDTVGINYSTLEFIWKANGRVIPYTTETILLNANLIGKSIEVSASYTDLLGVQKVVVDSVDNLTNYWGLIGSTKTSGTAYKIVNYTNETVGPNRLIRIEFSNGEFIDQFITPLFTDIKWFGPVPSPNDYDGREILRDFTTNPDQSKNRYLIDFQYTMLRVPLEDDQLIIEIDSNSMLDDFWSEIDELIFIGNNLTIGNFTIGNQVTRVVQEIINDAIEFYPTLGNYDYIFQDIGTISVIGNDTVISTDGIFAIGGNNIFVQCDTDEHYNLRESATETFEILADPIIPYV